MELFGYPLWAVVLVCIGVFIAALVDAIGGGGGLISLPVYLLVGLPYHNALGTNKMSSCIGTAASTVRYIKNGFVNWRLAIGSVVLALAGAYAGTSLQLRIDEKYLQYTLLVVLPIVAAVMLFVDLTIVNSYFTFIIAGCVLTLAFGVFQAGIHYLAYVTKK